jgi:hypothetical protein
VTTPMQPDARAALEEQLEDERKLWKQDPQRLREVLAEGSTRAKIPSITTSLNMALLQRGNRLQRLLFARNTPVLDQFPAGAPMPIQRQVRARADRCPLIPSTS